MQLWACLWGIILIPFIETKRPAHCRWHHSLAGDLDCVELRNCSREMAWLANVLASKPDDQIPGTHTLERENSLPQLSSALHMYTCVHT